MKTPLRLTLSLALLSGAAALSHELLWTRRLTDLLGATGEATSRVFGCFFLGLAVGAIIAARLLPNVRSAWAAIACCEGAIALLSIPVLALPWWSDWVWPALGPERLIGWEGAFAKTLMSVAAVLPPAIPMGMTLPFFASALLQGRGSLSRQGVLLYGVNTLGGVVGLITTSILLLPALGVVGSMAAAAVVNLAIGGVALARHRLGPTDAAQSATRQSIRRETRRKRSEAAAAGEPPLTFRPALWLSFVSGLAMLALEILSIRLLGLVVPSSMQATVAVLTSVILLLAIAAMAFPLLLRIHSSPKNWLLFSLSGAAIAASLTPWLLYRNSNQLAQVTLPGGESARSLTEFTLAVCALGLATVGPALLLGGAVLPAVFGWIGGEQGDRAGKRLGYLLAANGVGGILGAELTDLLVLPHFGVYSGFAVVAGLYAIAALLLLRPWADFGVAKGLASSIVAVAPLGLWNAASARLPYLNPRVAERYVYDENLTRIGREGVLLIVEHDENGRGILVNNQYLLGDTGFARDERREVLLPMLLHPEPGRVCCVGLATGISAGAALDYSDECELTAIEISSLVAEAAAKHFGDFNGRLSESPRARVIVEDGRTCVSAYADEFDVIVGDLYRPYGAGEGRLFSVEHFRATRRALRSGGLFCQWLPMYQLTERHFGIVVASFLEAYPNAGLIRANRNADNPILGLIGTKDGNVDLADLDSRCEALESGGRVDDADLLSPSRVREFYLGRLDPVAFRDYPCNTLDNALVELLAGRRRVTQEPDGRAAAGQSPYLQGDAWKRWEVRLPTLLLD